MRAFVAPSIALAAAIIVACGSDSAEIEEPASPCVAFERAPEPSLALERIAGSIGIAPRAVVAGGGHTYVLGTDRALRRFEGDGAVVVALDLPGDELSRPSAVAVGKDAAGGVNAYAIRSPLAGGERRLALVRYASADGGRSFDPATEKVLLESEGNGVEEARADVHFGPDGLLYVVTSLAGAANDDPQRVLGKILRLDVSGEAVAIPPGNAFAPPEGRPEIWSTGTRAPSSADVDPELGELWYTEAGAETTVFRLDRSRRTAPEPIFTTTKIGAEAGAHVYRGARVPALRGRYVSLAAKTGEGTLVAIDRFGPSGTPQETSYRLEGPPLAGAVLGRDAEGELLVVTSDAIHRVVDAAPRGAEGPPRTLLATKCFDPAAPSGAVAGAIAYDVSSALWSDGAAKERFVVVPKGSRIGAKPDGDFVFPVGTVAVKTFAVDGKRVETRLFVQHAIESWTGYSYAWNAEGTDAELVAGNRLAKLPAGTTWYFPSTADCDACHTPAAGYTLGLEAKQLAGREALDRFSKTLATPIDPSIAPLVSLDAAATAEARARSYLHSNCSTCHREGSATGTLADLDLRSQTPLAATGLCAEPKVDAMDVAGARIVAPGDPARSILALRMRALDERRMPKLASSVVDEAGVAAVEAWIRELSSCP
ncbi:MAG: PQQ-dependent sugar dehydrogenase [Labilithrix sp.]|nr:PQQ-dependent sugar dehydrogenase [Labilithrix sp.]